MEQLKKYIQPVICAVSLIALFVFPFVNCDYGYSIESNFNGFTMAMQTYIGYLLVLLPFVLLLASFSPKYAAKKPLLSLAVPPLCIISWLLTVLFAKTFVANLADSTLASGAYITLICHIILTAYGCLTYRKELNKIISEIKDKNK